MCFPRETGRNAGAMENYIPQTSGTGSAITAVILALRRAELVSNMAFLLLRDGKGTRSQDKVHGMFGYQQSGVEQHCAPSDIHMQ